MRTKVICYVDEPSPIAYQDLYEEGDEWIKVQGCEVCPQESRRQCCGNCHRLTNADARCDYQIPPIGSEKTVSSHKPWYCVVNPIPSKATSYCFLEYKCVKGSMKGKIRRARDPGNVFVEG